jgi:tetratricopeptide (TPR) repeat protein
LTPPPLAERSSQTLRAARLARNSPSGNPFSDMKASLRRFRLAILAAVTSTTLGFVSCQQHTQTTPLAVGPAQTPTNSGPVEPLRLGTVDFPTSGSPAAQPHFLYGVAAMHSFWYEEALEAFARAAALDPKFAMAHWGEAMCYHRSYRPGSDYNAGRKALAKIKDVKALTRRERDYIEALRSLYGSSGSGDRAAYAQAMEKIYRTYPDDREAAAFYALALLGNRGSGSANQAKAGAIAEEVYRQNSNHPGAAHYIIHSYDDPAHASRALQAAHYYSQIAPDAPHALHMPSHIFVQLGMWREAASSNDLGWAASVDYVNRKQLTPTLRDYHNLHWLIYAALQQGRYAKATQLVDEFVRMRASRELASYSDRYINSALAAYLIETRRWDRADALFGAAPSQRGTVAVASSSSRVGEARDVELCGGTPAATKSSTPGSPVIVRNSTPAGTDTPAFLRAFSAAMARPALTDSDQKKVSTSSSKFPKLRELQLTGLARADSGDFPAALAALREAAAMEAKTPRPPGPPVEKPAHELLGEILLRAGEPKDAIVQFKISLERHPNRALSLLGRARAEAAAGEKAAAKTSYAKLLEIWQQADPGLPELHEARDFVGATNAVASRDAR